MTSMVRFLNLANNAKLEMVKLEAPRKGLFYQIYTRNAFQTFSLGNKIRNKITRS